MDNSLDFEQMSLVYLAGSEEIKMIDKVHRCSFTVSVNKEEQDFIKKIIKEWGNENTRREN